MSARTHHPHHDREHGTDLPPSPYRRARVVGIVLVVGLVLGLVLGIVWVASRGGPESTATRAATTGEAAVPGGLDAAGWVSVGDGPVTVAVYFDYLCPACGAFEAANGDELGRLLEDGAVTVDLRPIAFLDRLSAGTEYSTRAANAFATVVDGAPDRAWDFHRALYAHQPSEGGSGLTDAELRAIARDAGVPAEVAASFTDRRFVDWTAERTERAFADGIEGTPTIVVDGTLFTGDPYTTGDLTVAVEQAG